MAESWISPSVLLSRWVKENETGLWAAIVRARELLPQGVNILSTYNNKINQSSVLLWLINGVCFYIIISAFWRKKDKKTSKAERHRSFIRLWYSRQIRFFCVLWAATGFFLSHRWWQITRNPIWNWGFTSSFDHLHPFITVLMRANQRNPPFFACLSIFLFVRQLWLVTRSSLIRFIPI